MTKFEIIDEDTGEITAAPMIVAETGMVTALTRAELDTQIATARAYPRSITHVRDEILSLATLDEQTAAECMYALPRAGKPIRGGSIRLAEICHQTYGNCRAEARVVAIDRQNKVIIAEATFHDLQRNSAIRTTEQRRIADKRGRLFNDDMIVMTGKAACAIAKRNAIFAGIPKGLWRAALEAAERVVAGDIKTLATRRDGAVKAFAVFGVKPEQIFAALGVEGLDDITLEHIPTLLGMHSAIKSGEETVETMFDPRRTGSAATFDAVQNPLKDDAAPEQTGRENEATGGKQPNGGSE